MDNYYTLYVIDYLFLFTYNFIQLILCRILFGLILSWCWLRGDDVTETFGVQNVNCFKKNVKLGKYGF